MITLAKEYVLILPTWIFPVTLGAALFIAAVWWVGWGRRK